MTDATAPAPEPQKKSDEPFGPAPPQLALPKGGSIRGMGEKFAANPVTGTGKFSVPIYASPGRSGYGPQLTLEYDSGAGNQPFGFGWTVQIPSITRKTEKGLPQYDDAHNSDIFLLAGAEDLMPALIHAGGAWQFDTATRSLYGKMYRIQRYRPRVEGLFARIERWANVTDATDVFWRSISKENITSWYGLDPTSRIADPADASRIFAWLISQSYDNKGNAISYVYKAEDSAGIDLSQANERNRTRTAQRYVKDIFYGNQTPYIPDLTAPAATPLPQDWCFELVFDYGEHDLAAPVPQDTAQPWICRLDPFSTYRSTFEVRTYRLCRRVLMFHHFPEEKNVGANCLVRSTDLVHVSSPPPDPSQPFYSYLLSATQTGYTPDGGGGYVSKSLPPVAFTYSQAIVDETVRDLDPDSVANLPNGIDGARYRWIDLDGEGLAGVLTEQAGGWFYKANLSPANVQGVGAAALTLPRFAPVEVVERLPALAALSAGQQQLLDLSGDGYPSLVQFEGPTPGYFERTEDADWEPFIPFESMPSIDWRNPNLRFIDLTGDGFPDLLISEDDAFWWHNSLSTQGFGPGQRVAQSFDEEKGPQLVFSDGTESIFLADMSGDGLTDLVRIRVAEVCYWPNLGYGRFGPKVTLDGVSRFDRTELFDAHRVRLADIDGSGTADIIYFAAGAIRLYFNRSGNALGPPHVLSHFPSVDSASSAAALDLLGNGTACLVWSSPLTGNARAPMRYIDLMGGQKPHLLIGIVNSLGAETHIHYAPSTKFYVADKLAGTPWITRLPFPVHVVEQIETIDTISRNRFVTRHSYHHGYYDGIEREFRGFARVDQCDTADFATLTTSNLLPEPTNENAASNVPPVLTKTWFHTGFFFDASAISTQLQGEYYREGDPATGVPELSPAEAKVLLLGDTVLPTAVLLPDETRIPYDLSGEEMREACRALRGQILRREVYALDGTAAADRPYTTSEHNYAIEMLQPQGPNPYGVFLVNPREALECHYERKLFWVENGALTDQSKPPPGAIQVADPRVTHVLTPAVDAFANVLQSVAVAYGRRFLDPSLSATDQASQGILLCTATENTFTNPILTDDANRTPMPAQASTYELLQCQPAAAVPGFTNLFAFDEMAGNVATASDGAHDIPFENLNPSNLTAGQTYRRLLSRMRSLYRPDDLGQAAGSIQALLPLGTVEALALPGVIYHLALTPGLIPQVFTRTGTALLPTPATVLESTAADGGGYVDVDGDGNWWIPSSRVFYAPTAGTPQQEATTAAANFYLPRRFVDPFGNATVVTYDPPYNLLVTQSVDALNNVTATVNDYRVLAPTLLTDPNGNQSSVRFDALGLIVGSALMGKLGQKIGDSFNTFTTDLTQAQIDAFVAADDPHTLAAALLGTATTRIVYDLQQYVETSQASPADQTAWQPVFAATLAREIHESDLSGGAVSPIQITFSYWDGFGREIQKKMQAEPGPATDGGPTVSPRWIGSGWTTFNNKGKPVRKYEPFFSALPTRGHQFEFGVQVGVSPVLCYDPLDRVVATVHPNHSYEKVVFDPWHQQSWDVNDTVSVTDPSADADVGDYIVRLPAADYMPTWYQQRSGGALGQQEQNTAAKALAHANTPTTSYFDALSRTMLTVIDNAAAGKYATRIELDIQGNLRSVTDALNRQIATYDYDLLGMRLHQASMESGQRWTLPDITGKKIRTWDERGHNFRAAYDTLRRPTNLYVLGTDATNSDPRTLAAELCYSQTIYGEGQANAQALNLCTRVFQINDVSGINVHMAMNSATGQPEAFDFKGNLLRSSQQFVSDPKMLTDWNGAAPLMLPAWVSSTTFDALNRFSTLTSADGSIATPTYNERNKLKALGVNVHGVAAATAFVTDIEYNASGQRLQITCANAGTNTVYAYDPLTFRMTQLTTTRPTSPVDQQIVQDLAYTYDPFGNVTHIQDDADLQDTVFFRNVRVEPSADYTYDAIYRLIEATGRELLGISGGGPLAATPTSYNDVPRVGLVLPGDGNAMGIYDEQYQYDAVGNFLSFVHRGSNPSNPGWTRTYVYSEPSQLNAAQVNNRLTSTTISGSQALVQKYAYDSHGNMTVMPQLQQMQWDFLDQLEMTRRQAVNASDTDGTLHQGERTYYVYNAAGGRVRKTTVSGAGVMLKQRFYLGACELYQEYDPTGNVTLERQTLHVMDDKTRIAQVDTTTIDDSVPAASLPTTATRYQFSNHLGTAVLELDAAAAVISYEEYYPYGSTSYQAGRSAAEVSLKRYRYTGKEKDEETGLYYLGARYYAAWLGRWTACDRSPKEITNPYLYASADPVSLFDPSGHDPEEPSLLERVKQSTPVQFVGGVLAGTMTSFVPGGFLLAPVGQANGTLKKPSAAFQFGLGAGETATGVAQAFAGGGGEILGVGLDATGVGALAGVPINIASAAVVVQAAGNVTVGIANMAAAIHGNGSSGSGGDTSTAPTQTTQPAETQTSPAATSKPQQNAPPPSEPAAAPSTSPTASPPAEPAAAPAAPPAASPPEPAAQVGTYGQQQGHHVHQSASYSPGGPSAKGNPNHRAAVTIQLKGHAADVTSEHGAATAVQRNLNQAVRGGTQGTVTVNVANPTPGGPQTVTITSSGSGRLSAPAGNPFLEDQKAAYALKAANPPGFRTPEAVNDLVNKSSKQITAAAARPARVPTK
jgi:RHS repeat-associated protein